MPLPDKQNVNINFASGLDTKTDPFQVSPGKMLSLENTIFSKGGLLQKRNGYGKLPSLPDTTSSFVTTFNGNLTAIGDDIKALSAGTNQWVNKGALQPLQLSVLPLIRSNANQTYADAAVSSNGLVCTAYRDVLPTGTTYKYAVADSTTGQNLVAPTMLPLSTSASHAPKVFTLGNYFVIVYDEGGTARLSYVAINIGNTSLAPLTGNIATDYVPSTTQAFDGTVVGGRLYIAYNGTPNIKFKFVTEALGVSSATSFATQVATLMSVTADINADPINPIIYAAYYNSATSLGFAVAVDADLNIQMTPQAIITATTVSNIISVANETVLTVYSEVAQNYSFNSAIDGTAKPSNYINTITVTGTTTPVVGTASTLVRSVGLASKAFLVDDIPYFLALYFSGYQPTYFLINGSGQVVSKLAYSNGANGYYATGVPGVTLTENVAQVPYLIRDLISPVNKNQSPTSVTGVYSQTGINLASFVIGDSSTTKSSEIGQGLHLTGGFLWVYDGYSPVEHQFHLWPDDVGLATSTSGGSVSAQQYFYQVTYEWTDNQGNVFRSAPSIPVTVTTTGASSTNTIRVPTLRLTYKTANPVKIVVYRWSTAQQTYYALTPMTVAPTFNSTTTDSVTITDTFTDAQIVGNAILYTTGGVVENIAAPATDLITLFQSRLFLVSAEDPDLLWYSKQVIEGVPVEMSDLFTIFVAPTAAAQQSTGPTTAISSMDDKLIIFKRDAIYYLAGSGPDNTGANNQYGEPTSINSTVGCANQKSIVLTPQGIMFQSDKGIWLLGRDLSTNYIGAPVEQFNDGVVQSAVNVPGTNQVRLTLDTGFTLMYDYFFGQWGTFTNVPAISSTVYQSLHTFINTLGQVFQESVGSYTDGSHAVLMSFTTSWFNLGGLQGFERAYEFYLLGTYISPHKLNLQIAYDYNPSNTQTTIITPDNYSGVYGTDSLYGGGDSGLYGGYPTLEQWRVFLQQQKCQSFQITMTEVYDASYGVMAGAGFTLSGIDLTVGVKSGRPKLRASRQAG